ALENAEFFLKGVRSHWEIENKLHWGLECYFQRR
ncbi:MAG: putative transposase YbfD/YdcC, partial [Thermoproteota archaeon]